MDSIFVRFRFKNARFNLSKEKNKVALSLLLLVKKNK